MSRKVETEKDANLENSEKNEPSYWVYILKCIDNTLYTGVARDPYKRLQAHNSGKGAKYTRNRRPCKLLYTEWGTFGTRLGVGILLLSGRTQTQTKEKLG